MAKNTNYFSNNYTGLHSLSWQVSYNLQISPNLTGTKISNAVVFSELLQSLGVELRNTLQYHTVIKNFTI